MKKYFALLLSCIILLSQGMVTFAEENDLNENYKWVDVTETEWIENNNDIEISPCLLYIANVITSIVKWILVRLAFRQKLFVWRR